MTMPLEIVARHVDLPQTAETTIHERTAKLETFHPRITSCRVAVDVPHRHHRHGPAHTVRIDLAVPGGRVVVKPKPRRTLLTAIQDAFDAAERKLKDFAHRQRGA